ncbi:MAG TPA: choice-of-anchor tandem repeat GloVer-containing protein [Chthonomonadaceae bacterium]|nr:choice-of-anchor tandem repeat GloVer-containing protein [Chthonomonadaceae bacterium]
MSTYLKAFVLFFIVGLTLLDASLALAQNFPTLTTVHAFNGSDGAIPTSPVLLDTYLLGITSAGNCIAVRSGNNGFGYGVAYQNNKDGSDSSGVAFSFTGDGAIPRASLVEDNAGNFYGTTMFGGLSGNLSGTGTIFKVASNGNLSTLYSFSSLDSNGDNTDGAYPAVALILGTGGNLYGTTSQGGQYGSGTIYKLSYDTINKIWNLTTLYSFSALGSNGLNVDGANPFSPLVQDSNGNFYGTTRAGGQNGNGTIFGIYILSLHGA